MSKVRIVAFDVSSPLAQFRKNYTTTSALTFSIPPPSSLRGLVGAILGLRYGEMQEKLDSARFGVQVLTEIKKTRIMTNLINTKEYIGPLGRDPAPRIQVRYEYVYNPKYRVYFTSTDEELMDDLVRMLKEHKSYFTPYLGVAYCIANLEYVEEHKADSIKLTEESEVLTAVPKKWISRLSVTQGRRYMVERMPIAVDEYRTPKGYIDFVFDAGGAPLSGEFTEPLLHIGRGRHIAVV